MTHYKKTIILLIISIFLAGSATAQYTLQNRDVVVNSDGVLTSFSNTTQKNIVIPAMLDRQTITSIGAGAFAHNSLTSVDFSGLTGLTSIGESAFYNNALTSVDFSGLTSLTSIGEVAFYSNALTSIDLSGLTRLASIGENAFQNNGLTSFTFPPSTLGYTMPSWDVSGSSTPLAAGGSATDVTKSYTLNPDNSGPITYTITYVLNSGTNAAANPANYTAASTITLAAPTRGGYYLFGWYTESAFTNKVTGITVGSTEDKTFYARWEVSYTLLDEDVVVSNGVLTTFSNTTQKNIVIPAMLDGQTITSIGLHTFYNKALTSVDFSGLTGLTSIESWAFRDNALPSVNLSGLTSLASIGYRAFYNNALTSVDLSQLTSLTSIGSSAFESNSLTSVDLSQLTSLTSIGYSAFWGNALTSVDLSGLTSLTSIGSYAFSSNSLTSVDLSQLTSLTSIGENAFNNNALTSFTLPPSTAGYTMPSWDVSGSSTPLTAGGRQLM